MFPSNSARTPSVCAVSYLNTVPLVWGLLQDAALQPVFNLRFALPSRCAEELASGEADLGIVPVIEMARQKLDYFPGLGISSVGPVRSILLVSKVPYREIKRLTTDSGSRTSVMLARIILAEKFGAEPRLTSQAPELASMLGSADAALLIGDAALHIDPATLPFETLDLGAEWTALTGLPMVFAVWAGRKEVVRKPYGQALADSCRYGLSHIEEIIPREAASRKLAEPLVRRYLTRHIVFEFGPRHEEGLAEYLKRAAALDRITVAGGIPA
ncbi:MAG TPA: menaquinone biosynthesis protein [Bryobacteraceae bacterium]|nr:menaquinone biosynthesis protein [Bryobacteraceae bacterium]